jgi:hypothetical protein
VPPTTVLRVQVQARHGLRRGQRHGQLQLCVPLVALKGDSYRLKDRQLGRVPAAINEEN